MVTFSIQYLCLKRVQKNLHNVVILFFIFLFVHFSMTFRRTAQNQLQSINPYTKTICTDLDNILKARHKVCFLRPDTGPCRADIIQWYFDVKQLKCYRFFWGGCQGNGNKFESKKQCYEHCYMNPTKPKLEIPQFCSLAFDYGSCFGHFNRWGWDKVAKTCKRRLYSGCGGNQNNFETQAECLSTCLSKPKNTMPQATKYTTCIPFQMSALQ